MPGGTVQMLSRSSVALTMVKISIRLGLLSRIRMLRKRILAGDPSPGSIHLGQGRDRGAVPGGERAVQVGPNKAAGGAVSPVEAKSG